MLTINEIFHSIQGESSRAGQLCVFVRLTACDLRCSWCDTPYAFHEGRKMSVGRGGRRRRGLRLAARRDHRRRAAPPGRRLSADGSAARGRPDGHARDRRSPPDDAGARGGVEDRRRQMSRQRRSRQERLEQSRAARAARRSQVRRPGSRRLRVRARRHRAARISRRAPPRC